MKSFSILYRLDLKARIAIFSVTLFISAIWLLALHLDKEVRSNFVEVLAVQQFHSAEHIAGSLDAAVKLRINALNDAATLINPDWMANPARLHAFLAARIPIARFFSAGLFIISREGIGLADLPNLVGREGASFVEMDIFRETLATGKPVVGKPILGRFSHQPIINIAVPVMNSRNEVIGVLVGGNQITGGSLLSEIVPDRLHLNGDLHVMSPKDGMFVTSTDPVRIMQPDPAVGVNLVYDRYRQGYEGSEVGIDSSGVENLSSAKRVPNTSWLVIATLPTSVAFEAIDSTRREIYKDAVFASVVIALLLWLFLYRQLRPLSHSAQTIDAMADGREPLHPLPLEGSKEIRRLLGSFNKLQKHIGDQAHDLQERSEQMRLAASVFEGTSEAILITSPDGCIVSVNRSFCRMTGYDEIELIGKTPRLLHSGRQDRAFYQEMWSTLFKTNQWHGEIWNRRKNGEIYPERLSISVLHDEAGKVLRYIAITADITKQKNAEELIWRQANYDFLSNLPNRRMLNELMGQTMQKSRRDGLSFVVMHINLDHFKEVNDTLGHGFGDEIIIEAGKRISACAQTGSDTVAHLCADDFIVMLDAFSDSSPRVEELASEILRTIARPFHLGSETVHITASIGIACYPTDAEDVVGLLKNVNQAKHAAKTDGRNRYCNFTASMELAAQTRLQLANDMRGALAADQFEVYYQPIVDLDTGKIIKAEALLRWNHPERGMVSPVQFIPIAEEIGLINEIGDWVFKEAAQLAKRWNRRSELSVNDINARTTAIDEAFQACLYQVTVNKSPRQFFTGNTDKTWIDYLDKNNINCNCIAIEITEGLLLDQHPEVMDKLNAFREAGIQIALDDFGTGYSAMSYLKKFDIDYLKIDRSFVHEIVTDRSDRAIVEAIIVMAHKLGMKVVAEGIETIEQRDMLIEAGCDHGQGYFFAQPMTGAQFENLW